MSLFEFDKDFAGNWKAGQIVNCEEKSDGILVDRVALINKKLLESVGHWKEADYSPIYDCLNGRLVHSRDFAVGDYVKHFKGGVYRIVTFCKHTETGESMIVYKRLSDGSVWARPESMFRSEVDKEKYPDVKQSFRFIRVRIA